MAKLMVVLMAIVMATQPAFAESRTVQKFLDESQSVQDEGLAAMFGSRLRSLMDEANDALAAWKAQRSVAVPKVCAPEGSENMPPDEFLNILKSTPVDKRSKTSVKSALISTLNRKYRCRV